MIKAFQLEWLKIRNYKVFWILLGLYLLALVIISSFGVFFLEWLKAQGADFEGIDPTIIPIYDFPDIWQNTTYLASFLKVLLAFIVIISVNNDQSYLTLRQNVIDGISKKEFLMSKLMLIVFLALTSACFLFLAGLINGSIYSHVQGVTYIFSELEFLAAYCYDIIVYCTLAFLLTLLIKKTGFVIIVLFLYTMMFEPILAAVFEFNNYFEGSLWEAMVPYFPIKSLNNLIPVPFPRYFFQEIVDDVPMNAVAISTVWLSFYLGSIYFLLSRRDLK